MNCNQIRERMLDLAAGRNTATPEMNEHLRGCAACAGKLEEFRQTMALLDEWQAPGPSPYFEMRLQARLREERAQAPADWLQWVRKPALALALTVLMAAGITLVHTNGGVGTTPTREIASGIQMPSAEPGTAVGDLQQLDKNHDLYSDFDVLDDLAVQQDVTANP
jgi:predicted anti-sigma-YlaC factor YlaD